MTDSNHHIIFHANSADLEEQELGPYGLQSLITETDEIHMTAYRVTVRPHATTAVGYHEAAEEIYYVISGAGEAVLNGKSQPLQPGDFLRLPPGTTHGFITGKQPLVMLDIHSPGSRPNRDIYFIDSPPDGFTENN
ncbi:MAG: cupin domain-containing protein [Verrucomicrobiota bacterium]